jgi:hypothetical protein
LTKKHDDHGDKVFEVVASDAIIKPFTVVVKITSASVAVVAVFSCLLHV